MQSAPAASMRRHQDAPYSILRVISGHVRGFWSALAAALTIGVIVCAGAAAVFALLAAIVAHGITQDFDDRVLRWLAAHRTATLDSIMLQLTTLGATIVLVMMVVVVAAFLWLTQHRWSVYILVVSVIGGQVLNNALKLLFARPRPTTVDWVAHVSSASFPSGHAMAAIIAYGSMAYLIARLGPTRVMRVTTWALAVLIIFAIGGSRIYLGVHYPSDVLGGFLAGLAWLAFVAWSVTALQYFAPRRPATRLEERDL